MKNLFKYGVMLAACAVTLSSCNCFKKMAKNQDQISVVANPEVLTLVGNEIVTDVTVVFPEEYYNPKAIVRITPMLVFDGGVIEGAPKYFQGEKVNDNYTVISKANGGVYNQRMAFPWDPRARKCTLEVKVEGKCNEGDEFQLGGVIPVAEGVNTLQQDLVYADSGAYSNVHGTAGNTASAMLTLPDYFKRMTQDSESVKIMYQVNQSDVRKGELTKEQTKLFEEFIRENTGKERVTMGNIEAKGYASPEGPEGLNDRLSKKRSESGKAAVAKALKDMKGLNFDVAAYGEDWEGFKALVEASDMKDKNLIVQVLNMYSSSAQRDAEIKNMSAVFAELKESVLPELRRTQMIATVDIEGLSDDELRAAVHNDIKSLNLEELLYAATLIDDDEVKEKVYDAAIDLDKNDARAWNNRGVAKAVQGDWNAAEKDFEKALELSSNPAIANNLALVALALGDRAKAAKYLPSATEYTQGLAAVHAGDYATASSQLSGYNKAVAEVLNGNLNAAKNALVGDTSAAADYLRGVIAAKGGDVAAAAANVKQAIEKAPELKEKALNDVNLKSIAGQL